ncbi:fumarylacetoacetate hydrolase family protein [Massilia sp. W12]|uniref:fumarylacetoacetate hydrolase family protein n=1 Tax=Massilia sp. W12 TaxID=3126507 RepID=UPI0030CA6829
MPYVFPPLPPAAVPVAGRAHELFPVHRIYCVGRNYAKYAIEMGGSGRDAPFFFTKPADAVLPVPAGAVGQMPYPPQTHDLHHEIELVVAIGKDGFEIPAALAMDYVWGYAVGLDMTRRDLQIEARRMGGSWCTAKGFDHAAPIGPIYPISQTGPLQEGEIWLNVNGAKRQRSNIDKLIWNVPDTIEQLSRFFELKQGDLIFTGSPEGVAEVQEGDLLEGGISGLGELRVMIWPRMAAGFSPDPEPMRRR